MVLRSEKDRNTSKKNWKTKLALIVSELKHTMNTAVGWETHGQRPTVQLNSTKKFVNKGS